MRQVDYHPQLGSRAELPGRHRFFEYGAIEPVFGARVSPVHFVTRMWFHPGTPVQSATCLEWIELPQ